MRQPTPKRVSITIRPVPGNEPDTLDVAFRGVDGSQARGPELTLPAGKVGSWEITATAADTVAAGGGFLFQRYTFLFSHRIQDYNPQGRDFVTLESHADAELRLIVNSARQSHFPSFAQVLVEKGEMKSGDSFVIRIGDRSQGGLGSEVYDVTTLGRIEGSVDRDGGGTYRQLACNPARILITSDPRVALLRVLGPSIVPPGERFALHLVAFDAHHNACEQYEGEVKLSAEEGLFEGLPASVSFGRKDRGILILEGIRIGEPGCFRLTATDAEHHLQALSNPILCQENSERLLLWGEFHCHTYGDAVMGLIDDPNFKLHPAGRHEQGRRIGRYDFLAPGPMAPQDPSERPEIWEDHQQAYRENDEPGRYVPFLASEVHTRPGGDRNMVFRDWSDSYYSPAHGNCRMDDVMAAYANREDVILEAHIGGGPPDWEAYKTEHEPLLEIASGHGSFEWVLQRALNHGYRPAIIGSGDTHLPTAGSPMAAHSFRGRFNKELNLRDTGFGSGPAAAVLAERCERNAIWKAVRERRTYATTGARIILNVTVNGHRSGSEIDLTGPAKIAVKAHACAPVERVDLIRNDRCLHSWYPEALDINLTHVDEKPLRGGAYYVRLRQTDGEYAWSTPVWTHCSGGAETPDDTLPLWNAHEAVDLSGLRPNAAEAHEAALRRYLEVEEDIGQFHDITPVGIVEEVPGRSALFYGYFGPGRDLVSIRWYFEFDMPRIHLDWGWRDFGLRPTGGGGRPSSHRTKTGRH